MNYDINATTTNSKDLYYEEKRVDYHDQDQTVREKKYNDVVKEKRIWDNLMAESSYIHDNFNRLNENKQQLNNKINKLKDLIKDSDLKRQYMAHNFLNLTNEDLEHMVTEIKQRASKLDTQIEHYKPELTIDELLDKNGCFNGV